jgi:anionic cell wall polymer biosynthesis LytR-Cps2A-Psr (LCP) family protein
MKKRRNPVWRLALTAVVILTVAVLLAVTVVKLLQFRGTDRTQGAQTAQNAGLTEQTRQALEENGALLYKGVRYVHRAGLETYLILGVDRTESQIASGVGNGQSDVLLLLVIEPRESRYRVLQINRDLVSQIAVLSPSGYVSSTMFKPICLAHAYASTPEQGCENTVNAVRYLLQDEPIDGYICMNLESIGALRPGAYELGRERQPQPPGTAEGVHACLAGYVQNHDAAGFTVCHAAPAEAGAAAHHEPDGKASEQHRLGRGQI